PLQLGCLQRALGALVDQAAPAECRQPAREDRARVGLVLHQQDDPPLATLHGVAHFRARRSSCISFSYRTPSTEGGVRLKNAAATTGRSSHPPGPWAEVAHPENS